MEKTLLKLALVGLWFYWFISALGAASEQRWDEAVYWMLLVVGSLVVEKLHEIVFHLMAVNYHLLKLIDKEKQNEKA
jgi:uncharacterized membrane protein